MYRLINSNATVVIQALEHIGDIRDYLQLRRDLVANGGRVPSASFQRMYRKYWRMNAARLSPAFFERYFELLAECQAKRATDIESITRFISDPGGMNNGLQFSFATKLAHMVDPRIPVVDSFVAAFYFFTPPASDRPFDERLSTLLAFHRFLQREYARILSGDLLTPTLERLRHEKSLDAALPDERLIDWLLWAWVSLLRQGAQSQGSALYD